ncbi:hypothetical protein QTG54_008813 [Skeletonema marinoi]|uniref:Uncharacterized protein n=1 Tax=Skeletonema marinoi TaxID=267567 RepID=A0AAD8Y7R0_9STRA|nr:hypothetical protein QTG54_008813 [Skeletonema marinoi]|mmetsp:Transcript_14274/g.29130  ORF Transcript_14274/g.29130 Transcript_14274/m.29130 type:complete len:185 (-) Transcript_14274:2909-3463(-)|eukprot:scaffold13903_cov214-Skeletonema_marinoi.AAC.2
MPFFWFGGETTSSTAADGQAKSSSVAISSHHARKSSLSLSASSGQNARLAEVRSEATASYLQHQSIDMGGNHRRTQSGDISRRSRTSTGSGHGRKRGGVVAIEDDDDSKHKGRIDQGLIDACNEAKVSPTKASWWTSFSVTAITPSSFPDDTTSNVTASKLAPPNINEAALKHRRTVSKTTYRV